MKKHLIFLLINSILYCLPCNAQEVEPSAEVFLEEYSDEFQENFFEALKQRGIENYDKAINLLLICKQIDPKNSVVDHELAKAYLETKQYDAAQQYAIETVNTAPTNKWYLATLVSILEKQGNTIEAIKTGIPYDNIRLRENLATLYYEQRKYEKALNILKGIKNSAITTILMTKIQDSLREQLLITTAKNSNLAVKLAKESPTITYKKNIASLIADKNYIALEKLAAEALEEFPLQPYFYYASGLALNNNGKHEAAIEILEESIDYLLDDDNLANKIYKELANAYNATQNSGKANMYLSKVKSGS